MADKALEAASQISNKRITGIISYWYNGQWINIADTNQRNNMQKSIDELSGLDKTIAKLPHSYYSPDQPTGTSYNDTDRWYKITTGNDGTIKYSPYKWDSTTSSWKPMLDQSAIHGDEIYGEITVKMDNKNGFLITNASGQVFHVDTAGNLTMQGDITAGNISGVNFAGNNLTLAGILTVTGAISSQFSYTDDDSIKHDGETVISNGGIKTVDTQTMPTAQTNNPVTTYSFDSNGYRVITYKDDDAYKAGTEISKTSFDNNGIILTMADIRSAYRLGGFSGTSATDSNSTLATIQFGDMLQYASSEVQHSGTPDFKDWFDIIAGIQSHPNLLLNSTFINGQTSWSGFNAQNYMTNVTHDGNYAVCIESAGGGNFISQDLSHIPDPGNKICLSFWARIDKTDGGFNGGALITFEGINANYTAALSDSNPTYEAGWRYYAFNPITVPNGTTEIRFSFYNNEHTGNKVYYAQPMLNDGDHTWPYMPTY